VSATRVVRSKDRAEVRRAEAHVALARGEVTAVATYDFECQACGERFELNMPMSQHDRLKDDPPACPACGKTETRQVVSLFSCKIPSGY